MAGKKKYIALYIFSSLVFLSHYVFSGQAVYGDGIDYWAYLPSLYFDRNIDFENEYRHLYSGENNNSYLPSLAPVAQKTRITTVGRVDNPHPPGAAIIWLPAFALADMLSFVLGLPRNGYGNLYQITSGLWSIFIVILGLKINELLAYRFTKDRAMSLLTAAAVFFASPLLYYGSYDVLNSHFASFTLTSLFWYILLFRKPDWKKTLFLASIIGLATLVRLQEISLLIPTALYLGWKRMRILIPVVALILGPLTIIWLYLYGMPVPETYAAFGQDARLRLGSLFHPLTGFFSRTPLLLLGFLAAGRFFGKYKRIFWIMLSYFLVQFVMITFHGGWSAAAYGGRMYISTLPLFAILLGYLFKKVRERWNLRLVFIIVGFFSILNMVSIASFVFLEKEVNSGRKRGLEEHTVQKIERLFR